MDWFGGNTFLNGLVGKQVRVGLMAAAEDSPYTVVGTLEDIGAGFLMMTRTGQNTQTMVFARAIAFVHEQAEQSPDSGPSIY